MDRLKVLHLITHLGVGGALGNTLLTVKGLPRDRYEVHLAAGEVHPCKDDTAWKARAEECSDVLFQFPYLRRPVHLLHDIRVLTQLTNFIKEKNYDIVHTHCAKAGVLGRIAARRAGVPIVVHTFHSFSWQVAHAFHPSRLHNHLSSLKRWLFISIERHLASMTDALITVAESNTREAVDLRLAPREKVTTIYSGIDLARFKVDSDRDEICRVVGLKPHQPIVGTLSRLSTQKAPLDFVQAAKIILRERPNLQFIMVGDGPLTCEVRRAIGDEPRIKLLGFRKNVAEILSILEVFAMSSLWEGLGRSLTEAMIIGVPVAATAVDGVPELVKHKRSGLLSPPGNPLCLAQNIIWLLDHPKESKEMAKCAKALVLSAFSADRMVTQIESLYERLLFEKKAAN